MRLVLFSSRLHSLQEKIHELKTTLQSKQEFSYVLETYDLNSFEGMLKAVRLNVFSSVEAFLFDEHNRVVKHFTEMVPSAEDLVYS